MQTSDQGSAGAGTVPRRVALISSSYFPHPGGVEEHVRNVARELAARGHTVEVWTVDRGEHLGVRQDDGFLVRYLPTPLPAANPRSAARFLRAFAGAWRQWTGAVKSFRPDVLNIQCFGPNGVYGLALHHRFQIPLIVTSHGETFGDEHDVYAHSRLLRTSLRRALADAAVVTAPSEFVLDDLRGRFGLAGGVVVPNGVDLTEASREDVAPPPGATAQIVAVGRAVKVKGFDLLLRAFAQARMDAGVRLMIGGDGDELPTLKALARELGVDDRVSFPGRLTRGQVIAAMDAAEMVVMPSRVEAFGIVMLEAWRSGSALIATRHGGPDSIVRDGVDGLLVDPEDLAALSESLERLVGDDALGQRIADAGSARVREFTWAAVVDRYEDTHSRAAGSAYRPYFSCQHH